MIPKSDFVLEMIKTARHQPSCVKADFDFGEGDDYTALMLNYLPLIPECERETIKVDKILRANLEASK